MTAFHRSAEWAAFVRRVRPSIQERVDAGLAICIDCGKQVLPWQKWQVGHRLSQHTHPEFRLSEWNVGPSHSGKGSACNQSAGATLGNQLRAQRRKRSTDYIEWRKTA